MRKYLLLIITLIVTLGFTNVYAEDFIPVTNTEQFNNAVATGGNIRLEGNITESSNVNISNPTKIDLNGHSIAMGNGVMNVNSDLTILDSASNGIIHGNNYFVIEVGGNGTGSLLLQSGIVKGNTNYAIRIYQNSSMQMDGGTVEAIDYTIYNQSRFVLNNGTITSEGIAIQNHLNSYFEMNGGTVTITGGDQAVNFYGSGTGVFNNGEINATVQTSDTNGGSAIFAYKDSVITINGGSYHSYSHTVGSNGSIDGPSSGENAKFTITGGTFTAVKGACLYIPQINGVTTISGGTFTSDASAIEIRAGSLTITGGTFTGNREEYSTEPNHSGTTTTGAAVAVAQHNTKQPIDVNITGGTFNAFIPISFTNPQNNPEEDINKVKISIEDNGQIHFNSDPSEKDTVVVNENKIIIESPELIDTIKNITIEGNSIIIHDLPVQKGYDAYIEVYDEDDELLYRTTEKTIQTNGKNIKIKVKYDLKANPETAKKVFPFLLLLIVSVATIVFKLKQRKLVSE